MQIEGSKRGWWLNTSKFPAFLTFRKIFYSLAFTLSLIADRRKADNLKWQKVLPSTPMAIKVVQAGSFCLNAKFFVRSICKLKLSFEVKLVVLQN